MAYQSRDAKHKNTTVIYSIRELDDWLKRTRRTEDDQALFKRQAARAAAPEPYGDGDCQFCGWPQGSLGFVGPPAAPGEWAFGKVFGCPACWPEPIGENKNVTLGLSEGAEQQIQAAQIRLSAKGLR